MIKAELNAAQVIQRLHDFGEDLNGPALSRGLTAAAGPVKRLMKSLAPVRGGALRAAIGSRQLSVRGRAAIGIPRTQRAILVGPLRKVADKNYRPAPGKKIPQGYKAVWLEYGVKPHKIQARKSGGKRGVLSFGGVFAKKVAHPGFTGRYFMAQASELAGETINQQFYAGMSRYLDRKHNA